VQQKVKEEMSWRSMRGKEVPPPSLEVIGDLVFSPGTDIPFGKRMQIGLTEQVVYESAVENGYQAGIQAHLTFLHDTKSQQPVALDDKQFSMIIKRILPKGLSRFNQGLWRAHFVAGWMAVYLGVVVADDGMDY
jgi:hypothetical protein